MFFGERPDAVRLVLPAVIVAAIVGRKRVKTGDWRGGIHRHMAPP